MIKVIEMQTNRTEVKVNISETSGEFLNRRASWLLTIKLSPIIMRRSDTPQQSFIFINSMLKTYSWRRNFIVLVEYKETTITTDYRGDRKLLLVQDIASMEDNIKRTVLMEGITETGACQAHKFNFHNLPWSCSFQTPSRQK